MDVKRTHALKSPLGRTVTRRELIVGLAVAVSGLATACGPSAAPVATQKPADQPKAAATSAPAPAATQAPTAKPAAGKIRIGALYPFTGSLALLGEESWRGAEVARLEQNGKGGIKGREIEFVKGDAVEAATAVSEANRLISNEKLQIILGTYSSTLAQAASEVAERNKVIYWEMGGVADAITDRGFQYLFRTCSMASAAGDVCGEFARDEICPRLGIAPDKLKVAIIHEDALWGTSTGTSAEKRCKEIGFGTVTREAYNSKTTDLSPLILKLKSLQPDVLIAASYIQDLLLYWKQARELDFNVKAVLGNGAGYSLTDFYKAAGSDADGVFSADFPQYEVNENYAKGIKEYVQFYKNTFKEDPRSGHSLANYMGALVLWDVIARAGSTDPEEIRKAALATEIKEGTTPNGWGVKFNGPNEKHAGQNKMARPIMMQWQKGKLVTVWPKAAAVAEIVQIPWPTWAERKK